MNNDILTRSVNKGIPVGLSTPIILRYIDLYNILTDKEKFDKRVDQQFIDFLNKILPNNEGFRFMRSFEIRTNPETLERVIIVSPTSFLNSLVLNLNYNNICNQGLNSSISYDRYHIYPNLLEERLQLLKRIKTEKDFEREFPFLYEKYCTDLSSCKPYFDFKEKILNNPKVPLEQKRKYKVAIGTELMKIIKTGNGEISTVFQNVMSPFYNLSRIDINSWDNISAISAADKLFSELEKNLSKYTLKNYIAKTAKDIEYAIKNVDKILNELTKTTFDFSFLSELDQNKLELYIAYMYMNAARLANLEDKQKCLYYVSNYFFEHHDLLNSNLSIHVGQNYSNSINVVNESGFVVTPKSLYEQYRQMLIDNPELRVVDSTRFDFSNMTLEDVNLYMEKYLKDLSASWEFMPPAEDDIDLPPVPTTDTSKTQKYTVDDETLKRRIVDMFMDKKEFYGSTNPMFRVKGKGTFDGYIGYIYPNGKVVLDKFYENVSRGELAYGNAVYIMNLDDFYELTKLSKTSLIRDKMCKRYVHSGDWKERVRTEITAGKNENKSTIKAKIIANKISVEDN